MKRYFFEPGAVQCFRKRGLRARLERGLQAFKGLLGVELVGRANEHGIDVVGRDECLIGRQGDRPELSRQLARPVAIEVVEGRHPGARHP